MADFSGQKAVVTGATKGIGRAIALALLKSGATVIGLVSARSGSAVDIPVPAHLEALALDPGLLVEHAHRHLRLRVQQLLLQRIDLLDHR